VAEVRILPGPLLFYLTNVLERPGSEPPRTRTWNLEID
jgi:hypothetical protein